MKSYNKKIEDCLKRYQDLDHEKSRKSISASEFKAKKRELQTEINPLLDDKIEFYEGEKEGLVFSLHELEELKAAGKISDGAYGVSQRGMQDKVTEIDRELRQLRAGRKDIRNLRLQYHPVVITRKMFSGYVFLVFLIFVVFLIELGDIDVMGFLDRVYYEMEKPFLGPSSSDLKRAARARAGMLLEGLETQSGFHTLQPLLEKTSISPDGFFKGVFIKPPIKLHIQSVTAENGITGEVCRGMAKINGVNLTEYGVSVGQLDNSFILSVDGCQIVEVDEGYKSINITIVYNTILGDSKSLKTAHGEITFY